MTWADEAGVPLVETEPDSVAEQEEYIEYDTQQAIAEQEAPPKKKEPLIAWVPIGPDQLLAMIYISVLAYAGAATRYAIEYGSELIFPDQSWAWWVLAGKNNFFGSSGYFLQNCLGCFIMGFVPRAQGLLSKFITEPRIFVGITTGFCGSLTTFATFTANLSYDWSTNSGKHFTAGNVLGTFGIIVVFHTIFVKMFIYGQQMADSFQAIYNNMYPPPTVRTSIRGTVNALTAQLQNDRTQLRGALQALEENTAAITASQRRSKHQGTAVDSYFEPGAEPEAQLENLVKELDNLGSQLSNFAALHHGSHQHLTEKKADKQESWWHHYIWFSVLVVLTVAIWIGAWWDDPYEKSAGESTWKGSWWKTLFMVLVFAPWGANLRYLLSLYNKYCPGIKWFTFLPNCVASFVDTVLQQYWTTSQWSNAMGTGFMGCLSTYSTFVNELQGLEAKNPGAGLRYFLLTNFVAQCLCFIINGTGPHENYGALDVDLQHARL